MDGGFIINSIPHLAQLVGDALHVGGEDTIILTPCILPTLKSTLIKQLNKRF